MVDRAKDMIITGGENVYSIEVEAALSEHPDVLEAAVFGIPDARWGEAVHAAVTPRPGAVLDAEALVEHARRRIAGFKVPARSSCAPSRSPSRARGRSSRAGCASPTGPAASAA